MITKKKRLVINTKLYQVAFLGLIIFMPKNRVLNLGLTYWRLSSLGSSHLPDLKRLTMKSQKIMQAMKAIIDKAVE